MTYTTGKRKMIIEFLSSNPNTAYRIEEISDALTVEGKGRSTVYRLVSKLVLEGCVKRLSDGRTRHATYQFVGGGECHEHLHLKCKGCGKLIHLDGKLSHKLENEILNAGGFTLEEGALLFGTCKACKEVKP